MFFFFFIVLIKEIFQVKKKPDRAFNKENSSDSESDI